MPNPVVVSVLADLSNYERGMAQVGRTADATESKFKGVGVAIGGALVTAAVVKFGRDSVKAFGESEQAQASLTNALSNSAATVGVSAEAFARYNRELAKHVLADDDVIAAGEAVLTNFGLTESQLKSMIPVVADVAVKLGTDIPTAAESVGKALLGNSKGLKALGIDFKASGDRAKDLADIQALLAEKTAGAAQAQLDAATPGQKLQKSLAELEETVGRALVPVLDKVSGALSGLFDWFTKLPDSAKVVAGVLGAVAAGIWLVVAAEKAWEAVQAALDALLAANPIGLIVLAVAALVAGLVVAWQHSETFRDVVKAAFQAVVNAVGDAVGWVLDYVDKLIGAWATVAEAASHLPGIGKAFAGVADVLRSAQHDVQGWADAMHNGIDVTDSATDSSGKHTAALKGEAKATTAVDDATKALTSSLKTSVTTLINPLKAVEAQAAKTAEALTLDKVREELNKGQEWESDYRKLSAAARAGLEPAAKAAEKTVLTLTQVKANLAQGIKGVGAWEADLRKIHDRGFVTLSSDLAQLGPDAAAAVHEAAGAGASTLGALQGQFAERARLIADPTIEAFTAILTAAAPVTAAATGKALHDALVAGGPVLTPEEAARFLGVPLGPTTIPPLGPGDVSPEEFARRTRGWGGTPAPAAAPQVTVNVHPAANASSREIATDVVDTAAWRLGPPRPTMVG